MVLFFNWWFKCFRHQEKFQWTKRGTVVRSRPGELDCNLGQMEHIRGFLWHKYSSTVNHNNDVPFVLDQRAELDIIVLSHWNNNPLVDMSLHSDTLSWFRTVSTHINAKYLWKNTKHKYVINKKIKSFLMIKLSLTIS